MGHSSTAARLLEQSFDILRRPVSRVGLSPFLHVIPVTANLTHAVAVFNYGLHYHTPDNFGRMLDDLLPMLRKWADSAPGRVPLFRELSAQHFKGGSWRAGADRPPPGTPCECEPLRTRGPDDKFERVLDNQNVEFNQLASARAQPLRIGVVPFFNLTAPRHSMHRRHFCSFSNQLRVGRCCDCTHLCYTPLFWDTFFVGLRNTILGHADFAPFGGGGGILEELPGEASSSVVPLAGRSGRRAGRGRGRAGRGRGRWRLAQAREMERRATVNS